MSIGLALEGTCIWRPAALVGDVEVVEAAPALRHFPPRLSTTLGICRKSVEAHEATSDGERLLIPAEAVILRPPDCTWSSRATGAAFVCIDIATSQLPPDVGFDRMRWIPPARLREFDAALQVLRRAHSGLAAGEALAGLVQAIAHQGFVSTGEFTTESAASSLIEDARGYLRAHIHRNVQLAELAHACGTNIYLLLRRFRERVAMTPHAYQLQLRIAAARQLLAGGTAPVDAAALTGFADQSHFGRRFKAMVGVSPGDYARQVRHTVAVTKPLRRCDRG